MKKLFIMMIIIVLVGITSGQNAFSENKSFLVGVEDISYYPHYSIKNNEYVGFVREVFDTFTKNHGYKFVYKPLPVMRLHRTFINGELDFVYPNNPEWLTELKKNSQIIYSIPLANVVDGVMVLPENKGKGLQRLKILSTMMGFTLPAYENLIKSNKVRISEGYKFDGVLKSVIKKHSDGAYVTVDCAIYHLREVFRTPESLVFDPDLPYDVAPHLLSTIKHSEIISNFDTFIIQNKGLIDQLKDKYQIVEIMKSNIHE